MLPVLVVCLVLGAGGYFVFRHFNAQPSETAETDAIAQPTAAPLPAGKTQVRTNPSGPEFAAAKARAVARYPELGREGSRLNLTFILRYKRYLAEKPEFFDDPEWPTALAKECAAR